MENFALPSKTRFLILCSAVYIFVNFSKWNIYVVLCYFQMILEIDLSCPCVGKFKSNLFELHPLSCSIYYKCQKGNFCSYLHIGYRSLWFLSNITAPKREMSIVVLKSLHEQYPKWISFSAQLKKNNVSEHIVKLEPYCFCLRQI